MNIERKSSTVDAKRAEERLEDVIALICAGGVSVYMVYVSPTYFVLVASASAALAIAFTAAVRGGSWGSYISFAIAMIGPTLALSFGMPAVRGAAQGTIGIAYFLYFGLGSLIGRKLFPPRMAS